MTNQSNSTQDTDRARETELILRIARAMKPRLFDPLITAEDCAAPGMVIARDHIFDQARAVLAALPELKAKAQQ